MGVWIHQRWMIQGMDQFPQTGRPDAVVPGEERLGRSLVGGLPRTDLHRINTIAMTRLPRSIRVPAIGADRRTAGAICGW